MKKKCTSTRQDSLRFLKAGSIFDGLAQLCQHLNYIATYHNTYALYDTNECTTVYEQYIQCTVYTYNVLVHVHEITTYACNFNDNTYN